MSISGLSGCFRGAFRLILLGVAMARSGDIQRVTTNHLASSIHRGDLVVLVGVNDSVRARLRRGAIVSYERGGHALLGRVLRADDRIRVSSDDGERELAPAEIAGVVLFPIKVRETLQTLLRTGYRMVSAGR